MKFNLFKRSALKTINKVAINKEIEEFNTMGVTGDNEGVIISLTSFPQRMYEIHYTLYSLLTQSVKPAKVILWLGKEQFPNLEADLPEKVLKLRENGLTIGWTNNMYSYTKLVPTLREYWNNIIVTADDDIFYEKKWLETLILAHQQHPDNIICHRAHKIKLNKNEIAPYKKWTKKIKSCAPSYLNFLTGVGGVLYPANCLDKEVLNEELFTKLAPRQDDVWFWAMSVINGTKTFVPRNSIRDLTYVNPERERGLTNEITLFASNKKGGNDVHIEAVANHYPQILEKLKS